MKPVPDGASRGERIRARLRDLGPLTLGAAFVFVASAAVGFVPLFGGVGYEADLAAGLLFPSAAAIAVARAVAARSDHTPLEDVVLGIRVGLGFAAIALVVALLHGLRVRSCDPWGGLEVYAFTAGTGIVLGGAWGACVGELSRGRKRPRVSASVLGVGLPLASALVSLGRFVRSPMIFAYDPFVGFFSGTLYDTVVDAGTPLLTYRVGSICTLVALLTLASLVERDAEKKRLRWVSRASSFFRERVALFAATALASLTITVSGASLGHYQTRSSIEAALGGRLEGARCDVVYPSSLSADEAKLLRKDCEDDIVFVEKRLGTRGPEKITAFFFRDPSEKRRLMGAEHTYIAKPWREEVYLQLDRYPHPVLGHELAHVIAGSFGAGPFRVSGSLGGLVPNPGLIEGVAVAASPDDDDVTDLAWAKTMMDLGILPPMRRIFSLGFLGEASSKSYTLAGAFVGWVLDTYGSKVVRDWYHGVPLESLVGEPWDAIEAKFKKKLETLSVSPEAAAVAKAKFDRPSLFGRRCPHVVDALRRKADGCRDARQIDDAIAAYAAVLKEDPRDPSARVSLAYVERRFHDREKGRASLEALERDAELPKPHRDHASEVLADADFVEGRFDDAAVRYRRLAASVLDEDQARTFEVKALAASQEAYRAPLGLFLLGDRERAPDAFVGAVALGRALEARPDDPVLLYLVGRNDVQHGFYETGATLLEKAVTSRALPTKRLEREALHKLAVAACVTSDVALAKRVSARVTGTESPFHEGGRKDALTFLLGRCLPAP